MPLTTDFFPSPAELRDDFSLENYVVSLPAAVPVASGAEVVAPPGSGQQQHVAACQNATELQYQQYYQQQQQQQQQAAAATPPFNAQMAGAAAASAYYAPPPLPQPLGPASAGLPGMYQQQPSAGLQPQLMAALNACQHAAASSPAQQWPQNLQQAGSAPKQGRKPPGSRNQNIRTVVFKRGKDGLQGKSLAQSCTTFDTCYLFQRDMAKNGSNSISRVRAEPQPFI
jgi:hypothetical protein